MQSTAARPAKSPSAPKFFGSYELLHRIGVGGMAETFLAIRRRENDDKVEQRVCVKRILPAFEEDQEFKRLFSQEAQIAARLRHANIVQVLDWGVVDESHYLTLELIEGMDLRNLLRALPADKPGLPPEAVTYLANEIAIALDYAHSDVGVRGGVFHRDISPSNVLVSSMGEIKLTDFGIAKASQNQGQATQTGVVKGKVPYLAPEYILRGTYDARGDLFSLGVMLYEALVGKRPFDGHHELETMARSTEGKHVSLHEIAPHAPQTLRDAIEKLILPNPDGRFSSASELLDALTSISVTHSTRRYMAQLVNQLAPPHANLSERPPAPSPKEQALALAETRLSSSESSSASAPAKEAPTFALPGPTIPSAPPSGSMQPTRTQDISGSETRTATPISAVSEVARKRLASGSGLLRPKSAAPPPDLSQQETRTSLPLGTQLPEGLEPVNQDNLAAASPFVLPSFQNTERGLGPTATASNLSGLKKKGLLLGAVSLVVFLLAVFLINRASKKEEVEALAEAPAPTTQSKAPPTVAPTALAANATAKSAAEPPPSTPTPTTPSANAATVTEPTETPAAAPHLTGVLKIKVMPFGLVRVDGGRTVITPREVRVTPGRHVLTAMDPSKTNRKTVIVTVKENEVRRVNIDIPPVLPVKRTTTR